MLLDTDTLIISCTKWSCGQKLRIPADRKRLIVTCPKCKSSWEWIADDSRPRLLRFIARPAILLSILTFLVLIAGVWTQAWLPTGLLLLACLVRWICRLKLSENDPETLWEKGAGVLYEATASACGAAAIGLGLVIGLITFLNVYPGISPTNYPSWLIRFETLLIQISGWTETSNNKLKITLVYVSLIICSFFLSLILRRYQKEWRPVRSLTNFKQNANKVLLSIYVITFFTFFSQAPINERVDDLAAQRAWRYGVAKRAEQEFEAKRLIAEELTKAAREHKKVAQDEKDTFVQQIADLRSKVPYVPTTSQPTPSPSPFPYHPPDGNGWRPPNWPNPPDSVLTKIRDESPLGASDYQPAQKLPKELQPPRSTDSPSENSRFAEANKLVADQIENAIPYQSSQTRIDPIRSDPSTAKLWPPKTSDQWRAANELLQQQELKADLAERRYGEAVQALLEGVSEYLGMQISADAITGLWIDLAISNTVDRVHEALFSKDSARFANVVEQLGRLFTPRETKAELLKQQVESKLQSGDYASAESLIAELARYPKTKAGKSVDSLGEEVSFRKVSGSVTPSNSNWKETIKTGSDYLSQYPRSDRAGQVRQWLSSAEAEKTRIEIEARKPIMLVYLRDTCSMSQYFREHTSEDAEVSAQRGRFRYRELNVDLTPPSVSLGEREVLLPIIVFQDRNGRLLDTLTGQAALRPTTVTMHMRAVAEGRPIASQTFGDSFQEILRRMRSDITTSRSIFSCPQ
jgi:hypothetical protein